MALYFLILLCACLTTSYFLLKKINNEISHLVAVFAAICLILGLILAPWQVLILLLIPVIISTMYDYYASKVVSRETETPQQLVPKSEPDENNLIYRGVCYRADPNTKSDAVTTQAVTHKLSFRGSSYLVRVDANAQSDAVTTQPVTYKLSFRGCSYPVNRAAHREIKEQGS
jgi:hypothetical protein